MDDRVKRIIERGRSIVFFGGAGVSTESGIPDFRSEKGLYNAMDKYGHSPESMLSATFFRTNTKTFYEYYRENLVHPDAEPNKAHIALAKLEKEGKLSAVITQNVDGLHRKAGSRKVYELHGSVFRNFCMSCGAAYDLEYVTDEGNSTEGIPLCEKCGGTVKPDVVLYEESLDNDVISGAVNAISEADVLIVGGTSLVVYPAAGLIEHFHGNELVLINRSKTPYDGRATLTINDSIGKILGE